MLAKQQYEFLLEKNVLANHEINLQKRADFVYKEMVLHEKRLVHATKMIAEQIKDVKEKLEVFFVKHEEKRENKRGMDRSYYKEKDKARKILIAEEHEYRRIRDEKALTFLDH